MDFLDRHDRKAYEDGMWLEPNGLWLGPVVKSVDLNANPRDDAEAAAEMVARLEVLEERMHREEAT